MSESGLASRLGWVAEELRRLAPAAPAFPGGSTHDGRRIYQEAAEQLEKTARIHELVDQERPVLELLAQDHPPHLPSKPCERCGGQFGAGGHGPGFCLDLFDQWIGLMRSFPQDGWDGAADQIARHDQRVRAIEERLDWIRPEWRDGSQTDMRGYRPRTRAPN